MRYSHVQFAYQFTRNKCPKGVHIAARIEVAGYVDIAACIDMSDSPAARVKILTDLVSQMHQSLDLTWPQVSALKLESAGMEVDLDVINLSLAMDKYAELGIFMSDAVNWLNRDRTLAADSPEMPEDFAIKDAYCEHTLRTIIENLSDVRGRAEAGRLAVQTERDLIEMRTRLAKLVDAALVGDAAEPN